MKTVLFFYTDFLLHEDKCDAYITPASNVKHLISWRLECIKREVHEGYLSSVEVRVLDKIYFSMMRTV